MAIGEDKIKLAKGVRLLVHTQPYLTSMGKKKPDVTELQLFGPIDEQIKYAKEKLGKEITIGEVFNEKEYVDIKAITRGKGIQGPVKRFGIKTHRPKAKKCRYVGSIGPWHPATVMFTVARAGQLGYQTRTEYNKRILMIGTKPEIINENVKSGIEGYGPIKNEYILLQGSIAGHTKRAVAMRHQTRPIRDEKYGFEGITICKMN